jgi:hypothetical protein
MQKGRRRGRLGADEPYAAKRRLTALRSCDSCTAPPRGPAGQSKIKPALTRHARTVGLRGALPETEYIRMKFETAWYRITLPPGYAGELNAGVLRIRCDSARGSIEVECICKSSGTTKDLDLKDHAGSGAEPCALGRLHGYRSRTPELDRWALSEARSNKLLLLRVKKQVDAAGLPVEEVLKDLRLK